ncbi:hypothetical protein BYT27DRAFT_7308266 [Phlegmacium glaucopus]|nr:hypothetical protein BYT27DRAFT_7308266 [Phlegmacium glaucopus]
MIYPVQRSHETYERHDTSCSKGRRIPQPNQILTELTEQVFVLAMSISSQLSVVLIFLFNICQTRDDPTNPEDLPDNFAPIHPPLNLTDVREFRESNS